MSGVSHEYLNNNFLRKGQAIDMSMQNILNLCSPRDPMDAVRKKYVNENFFKRGDPIDMNQKAMINVLSPVDEGDAVNNSYVDSKRLGESDLNMNGNSIRSVIPIPTHEDEVVPKQWIENNFLNRYNPASTMARDLNMDGHQVTYLKAPKQNPHASTKAYADTKLALLGGDMQGGIGMAGNRISHLGEPKQNNDAVRLSFANEYFLRRDGSYWMRNDLSLSGHRVTGIANPQADQDGMNNRTPDDMI